MEAIIKVKNLRVSYGDIEVIKGINLEVYPGEIIGYIGANGAGKSTTIKALLGIAKRSSGTIEIDGQDIQDDDYLHKSKIGYVPETAALYESLTGREYLNFIGRMYEIEEGVLTERIERMCGVFEITQRLDTRLSAYSKGMRQKILIISSMLHNPDILIFDEPINGMDANSVKIFKEIMVALTQSGKTILYSSHLMDVVERISSRIILIDKGEIIANDTFENLASKERQGSLEMVFNQLTGFDDYTLSATEFVKALKVGDGNDA